MIQEMILKKCLLWLKNNKSWGIIVREKSRTEHSAQNASIAIISKSADILLGYVVRIVLTHVLSEHYVGVSGLFSDIINILSITELGIGTAITYALYLPIKEKDIEKQKSLMLLFRKFYRTVSLTVFALGFLLIPFLPYLTKGESGVDHLVVIYLLYLVSSASSYLMTYKSMLIEAHQLSYICTLYRTIAWIIQDILQIIILLTTGNFILYLLMNTIAIIVSNFLLSKKAEKLYPYLNDRDIVDLPKEEKTSIFKNMRAMMMHKVGTVIVSNTDNLIISAFIGVVSVGKYSNYWLIITSIKHIIEQGIKGIAASVGNLGVSQTGRRIKKIFEATFFLCHWLYGMSAIILYQILNPIVALSFGEKYLFDKTIVLILCINFYIDGVRSATVVFRDSLGLFWYDRYKAVFEVLINLVVSVILAQKLGVAGVFIGTIASALLTSFWVEPYVLYKHRIKESVFGYFVKYIKYAIVFAVCFLLTDIVCRKIQGGYVITIISGTLVSLVISNAVMLLLYMRTSEFRLLYKKVITLLNERFLKGQKPADKQGAE